MAKPIELGIIAYQVIFKMLEVIIKIEKRSDALYIRVNFVAINSSKYYIYATNPF